MCYPLVRRRAEARQADHFLRRQRHLDRRRLGAAAGSRGVIPRACRRRCLPLLKSGSQKFAAKYCLACASPRTGGRIKPRTHAGFGKTHGWFICITAVGPSVVPRTSEQDRAQCYQISHPLRRGFRLSSDQHVRRRTPRVRLAARALRLSAPLGASPVGDLCVASP